jgi:hypothetical protein
MAEFKGTDDSSAGSVSTAAQSRQTSWASAGDSHLCADIALLALQKYSFKAKKEQTN